MATTVINVRLDLETKETLDLLAREMGRPSAHLAALAIAEYVRRNAWQVAAIKEGIRQLDAGQYHDFDGLLAELDAMLAYEEGV